MWPHREVGNWAEAKVRRAFMEVCARVRACLGEEKEEARKERRVWKERVNWKKKGKKKAKRRRV